MDSYHEGGGISLKEPAVAVFPLAFLLIFTLFSRPLRAERRDSPEEGGVGGLSYEGAALPEAGAGEPAYAERLLTEGLLTEQLEAPDYSRPRMLLYTAYTVAPGDIIGNIAKSYGLNDDTLLSLNNIRNARQVQIGRVLRIPNQDGIIHQVRAGESLEGIAERYRVEAAALCTVNELLSGRVNPGTSIFIPGARLNYTELQEINGDLFARPVWGYISSAYGRRRNPFGGSMQFHSGMDLAAPMGTPVRAAMGGRVIEVGYNEVMGNFVLISHHSGYRTLYGHLSLALVRYGTRVQTGDRIGNVGSTGLSTGPHLHFTVYKNGRTVNPAALMR
jgi:murein DD-endopeptidase MepM/ murein hydrolase activator NlpD